jgi:short-subunit dehydrogenase
MTSKSKAETVLITGASSGIGEALAWRFASQGNKLVLVARRAAQLNSLSKAIVKRHGVEVITNPADLSLPGAAQQLHQSLRGTETTIDILVNNAGVLEQGAFATITGEDHQRMLQLNVVGLTAMLREFLPPMLERGHGRILNVASIAGFMPVPGLATYAASKAYVLSLSEALAEEVRNTGVSVTVLCPGITATSMLDKAKSGNSVVDKMPGFVIGDVESVAREAYRGCMRGAPVVVPGSINLATTVTARTLPKWLVRRFNGLIGRATIES